MSITALWKEELPSASGSQFRCYATSSTSGASFYWYQDGTLAQSGPLSWFDVNSAEGEHVDIAVFDNSSTTPPRAFPGRVVLGWDAVDDAAYYVVQQYVDSAWATVREIPDRGQSYFEMTTDYLDDETTHQFRVAARGADGNIAGYREFTFYLARRPDAETPVATFDSGTGLTVDVAA